MVIVNFSKRETDALYPKLSFTLNKSQNNQNLVNPKYCKPVYSYYQNYAKVRGPQPEITNNASLLEISRYDVAKKREYENYVTLLFITNQNYIPNTMECLPVDRVRHTRFTMDKVK